MGLWRRRGKLASTCSSKVQQLDRLASAPYDRYKPLTGVNDLDRPRCA